jgi:hypothetical protein
MSKPINPDPHTSMSHVVSGLIVKRGSLSGLISHLQSELRQATADLRNVESSLRIFAPDLELPAQFLRPSDIPLPDIKGGTSRVILDALRGAGRPLSTGELTILVMKARGLPTENPNLTRMMTKRVGACLRHWKNTRAAVRSMPGPEQQNLWELALTEGAARELGSCKIS